MEERVEDRRRIVIKTGIIEQLPVCIAGTIGESEAVCLVGHDASIRDNLRPRGIGRAFVWIIIIVWRLVIEPSDTSMFGKQCCVDAQGIVAYKADVDIILRDD